MRQADAVRETELARLRALVAADAEAAGPLHADDFLLVTPGGRTYDKSQYLGAIADGSVSYEVFEPVEEIEVRRLLGHVHTRHDEPSSEQRKIEALAVEGDDDAVDLDALPQAGEYRGFFRIVACQQQFDAQSLVDGVEQADQEERAAGEAASFEVDQQEAVGEGVYQGASCFELL